jgi:phosphoglycerol transferase MdoB-like AlkP superfamily enzyme
MDPRVIIFLVSLLVYIPLAGVLLYVWWKHGKDDKAVTKARIIFLVGSFCLFAFMITL